MKYLDSTVGTSGNALASRLAQEVAVAHTHLRIKTGYFVLNGLGGLKSSIDHLVNSDLPITIAVGANEQATIKADVDALHALIGGSRQNARLCVVTCSGGLFHPKVVHVTRSDGSQMAYVGSANVTPSGFNGANVESGILLDSREGDPLTVLDEIAASVDDLFSGAKPGVTRIAGPATTQQLVVDGILVVTRPTLPSTSQGGTTGGGGTISRMKRQALVTFPPLVAPAQIQPGIPVAAQSAGAPPQVAPSTATNDILIAEIGKGVRWKQANFPIAVMQTYFGVNPTGGGTIDLAPVAANGSVSAPTPTKIVSVQSQNYRLELGSVAGVAYPATGRPIAVFRRTGAKTFRYRVFMPGDPGHAALSAGLTQRYAGPKRELRRITVPSADLQTIWSACPV
jgi:hypothetical protein